MSAMHRVCHVRLRSLADIPSCRQNSEVVLHASSQRLTAAGAASRSSSSRNREAARSPEGIPA